MSKPSFQQVKTGKAYARSGIINTRRGPVTTPFFMPVGTRGNVKNIDPVEVAATGAPVLLCNTYHLHLQPGEGTIKKLGGLHQFNKWTGPILTDSGGFQVFSLSAIRKITEEGVLFKDPATGDQILMTPEKSVKIQLDLGSDIIMAFDDLTGLSLRDRPRANEAMERTQRWLLRSIAEFQKLTKGLKETERPLIFGIVQGGLDKRMRTQCLDFVNSQPVDGVAIGGLAVGETKAEMYAMLKYLAPRYDRKRPHYLMGVGDPPDVRYAIEHGIDMFDCVLPTRNGRHGGIWVTGDKRQNLKTAAWAKSPNPIDNKCNCTTCQAGYSRAYLRHLFKIKDPLAGHLTGIHNLRYLQRICEEYQ